MVLIRESPANFGQSRPGDSERLEDKSKDQRFSIADIGTRRSEPHRGFYFRGSKRTSTSVFTLTGWPPLTVGL
jgi:hypothetical protein